MCGQQSVYILSIFNLFLAGIAIFCVTLAEDQPEYFSLIYIAISIFIFYMGTIIVIILLQIIETCQEQYQQNQSSLNNQRPISTTEIVPQDNNSIINDDKLIITKEPKFHLSRSHTLPLSLSMFNSDHTSTVSTTALKDFKTTSNDITTTSITFLPKYQQALATIHKNYQSFAFASNENHCA